MKKQYTILKIRYYADGINVRKGIFTDDNKTNVQHYERAKLYVELFWNMVFKVTGKKMIDYTFGFNREQAIEELTTKHGIVIPEGEEYYYWHIPIENTELIEWVKTECKLPFKILKRSPYSHVLDNIINKYNGDSWFNLKTK